MFKPIEIALFESDINKNEVDFVVLVGNITRIQKI